MASITEPKLSLGYLITIIVFVIMLGVGVFVVIWAKNKAAPVIAKVPIVGPTAASVASSLGNFDGSGNPNIPTQNN